MNVKARKVTRWAVCGLTLWLLAFGSVVAMWLRVATAASSHNGRIFELRIYHAVPGKLPVMEERFRHTTSKILARHHLDVVGYWENASDNLFVFLLEHQSKDDARKNWEAFSRDPDFQEIAKAEQSEKTLEKADIMWLEPTDFSPAR